MTNLRNSMSNVSGFFQIANAVRKGQTVKTVDTPNGRTYEIIINR
jgi:hypothetical protein